MNLYQAMWTSDVGLFQSMSTADNNTKHTKPSLTHTQVNCENCAQIQCEHNTKTRQGDAIAITLEMHIRYVNA